jgi:hypothetical protein
MLSLTESMLIEKHRQAVEVADRNTTLLETEILRLRAVVERQAETIRAHEATIQVRDLKVKADAVSLAGYRAYVDYMCGACTDNVLAPASDAYDAAVKEKAQSLGVRLTPDGKVTTT